MHMQPFDHVAFAAWASSWLIDAAWVPNCILGVQNKASLGVSKSLWKEILCSFQKSAAPFVIHFDIGQPSVYTNIGLDNFTVIVALHVGVEEQGSNEAETTATTWLKQVI